MDCAHTIILCDLEIQIEIFLATEILERFQAVLPVERYGLSLCVWAISNIELPDTMIIPLQVVDEHPHKVFHGVREGENAFVTPTVYIGIPIECFHQLIDHTIEYRLIVIVAVRYFLPVYCCTDAILIPINNDLITLIKGDKLRADNIQGDSIITHQRDALLC